MASSTTTEAEYNYSTAAYLALTTPFVQAPECVSMRDLGINTLKTLLTLGETDDGFQFDYTPIILSTYDENEPAFTSCQPPGGRDVLAPYNQGFQVMLSPGVCPQNWETFSLSAYATGAGPAGYVTEALCCQSGYTPAEGFWVRTSKYQHCVSTFLPEQSLKYTVAINTGIQSGQKTIVTAGMFIAPMWRISWAESDLPSLSPRPAIVTQHYPNPYVESSTMVSPTTKYTFGVPSDFYTSTNFPTAMPSPTLMPSSTSFPVFPASNVKSFLTIGLPIIFLSVLVSCSTCWWYLRRKQRKRAIILEAERMRMDLLQPSQVRTTSDEHLESEVLPAYTAHPPPSYKEN